MVNSIKFAVLCSLIGQVDCNYSLRLLTIAFLDALGSIFDVHQLGAALIGCNHV